MIMTGFFSFATWYLLVPLYTEVDTMPEISSVLKGIETHTIKVISRTPDSHNAGG